MSHLDSEPWDKLWSDIDELRSGVNKAKAININPQALRDLARNIVQNYFRFVRSNLVDIGFGDDILATIDANMQELLNLSHGHGRKSSYLKVLTTFRDIRSDVATKRERFFGQQASRPTLSDVEREIIRTLHIMLPHGEASYLQVVKDLMAQDRVSWRGSAAELREVVREVLDYLAPDDAVIKEDGFKFEGEQTRPTMKQKTTFVLKSRQLPKAFRKSPQDLTELIDNSTASFVRDTYTRGSVSTHVSPTKNEVVRLKRYVDTVLMELLEAKSHESS